MNQRHELTSRSKRKLSPKTILLWVVVFALFVIAFMAKDAMTKADTTSSSTFQAGNIMSDAVMSNSSTMNITQIQTFLYSKNACNDTIANHSNISWKYNSDKTEAYFTSSSGTVYRYYISNGTFVCMAKQKFSGQTAAQIIYQAAQDYHINPQVLIVLLQKEQGLVTDTWPNYNHQYAAATGYMCPDTPTGCDSTYAGFITQIRDAAALYHTVLTGGWSNYPVGTNYIQYNPNTSCGGSNVNIQNLATSALYRYTPYQPNAATLAANIGQTVTCGAYGNLNFFRYFTMWFGPTQYTTVGAINTKYQSIGGINSYLGIPQSNEIKITSGVYQQFENGRIYWSSATGAYAIHGGIQSRYQQLGWEKSFLGLPTSDEISADSSGGVYQQFENGRIYWSSATNAWDTHGGIASRYTKINANNSYLGFPISSETTVGNTKYQDFQNGRIYWSSATNAWDMTTSFVQLYGNNGGPTSYLGAPISASSVTSNSNISYQDFQGGRIYLDQTVSPNVSYVVHGAIKSIYTNLDYQQGKLGFPESNEIAVTGGVYQQFQNGRIYWSSATGAWDISSTILDAYNTNSNSSGYLGFPISGETPDTNGSHQVFQGGEVFVDNSGNTFIVHGAIYSLYRELGNYLGFYGYPTSNEIAISGSTIGATYQEFNNGQIYWSSVSKAHVVHGAIEAKYLSLSGAGSILGLPTSDEIPTKVKNGVYQQFQNGRIYWSSTTNAWSVHGGVQTKYLSLGAENSFLGYPTSDEIPITGGVYQQFQNGRIYWSSTTNAWSVHGGILNEYLSLEGPAGQLGYPTSDEIATPGGGVHEVFQHGTIYWNNNKATVQYQ